MKTVRIPIAKEGYPFIFFSCYSTLVFALLGYEYLSLFTLFVSALIVNFFRDPERIIPDNEDTIVAPADGTIIKVEKCFDNEYQQQQVQRVSIFMNIFNVHVNRFPCTGMVQKVVLRPGRFFSADSNRAALENECCAVTIDHGDGCIITCVQIAGLIARRIVCWAEKGDRLIKGARFGLIRFGSRVDLYLPLTVEIKVSSGQKVVAGETIVGTLQREEK